MKRIYTRTGDDGTTGLHGGTRVAKDDIRVEAYGTLDELNCVIGVARSEIDARSVPGMTQREMSVPGMTGAGMTQAEAVLDDTLLEVQRNLMAVMSIAATPSEKRAANPNTLPESIVADIEAQIDFFTGEAGESGYFLLPGGTPLAAQLQMARAVCRRAERRLWTLHREDPLPDSLLHYINRLSDLLFIMARCALQLGNVPEERWNAFTYKHKGE